MAEIIISAADCPPAAVVPSTKPITPITKANYTFAETEVILADYVKKIARGTCSAGVGVFQHLKNAIDLQDRTILRPSFDTLYSFAVLDLESPCDGSVSELQALKCWPDRGAGVHQGADCCR